MKKFEYYDMAHAGEVGDNTLHIYTPLGKNGLPDEDSIDKIDSILEGEGNKKPYFAFKKGRRLKEYWEQTDKVIYVDKKGSNFLTFRNEVFIVREEVKEEIERIYGEEVKGYLEFLNINLVEVETKEEVIDCGKWYIMNILKLIEGVSEEKIIKDGKLYNPVLFREEVLDENGNTKYPIFRLTSLGISVVISNKFKDILDKFDDPENALVYFYDGLYFMDELEGGVKNESIFK